MSSAPDPLARLIRTGRAATYVLIALLGGFYVMAWLTRSPFFGPDLVFGGEWSRPWTAITYPFASSGVGGALVWELLLLWWLYWIGSDLERELGPGRMLAMFAIASVVGAASVYLGWFVAGGIHSPLAGSLIPIGTLTVAWGTRHPTACVRLYAILPITGKWIAIIQAAIVLFVIGDGQPFLGVFALIPLGLGALYAAERLPGFTFSPEARQHSKAAKATERRDKSYYEDVFRRAKEREERERLRKLFESSIDDDK